MRPTTILAALVTALAAGFAVTAVPARARCQLGVDQRQ